MGSRFDHFGQDFTSGCTAEACGFRDIYAKLRGGESTVVLGVSADAPETHKKFKEQYKLPFTLLSDPKVGLSHCFFFWSSSLSHIFSYRKK
jgi:peroxiredoxin Q/BCP